MTHTLASSSATSTTQYLMAGTLQYSTVYIIQGSSNFIFTCITTVRDGLNRAFMNPFSL